LASEGITVAAPDLIGHGASEGRRGDVGDVVQCAREIGLLADQLLRPQTGHARYALFGHSFGGLVAIMLALQRPEGLSRLVVQSPLLEVGFPIPRWKAALARALARWWPACPCPMNLDERFLSRDPAVGQAYRHDPLVHNVMSAGSYRSILQAGCDAVERAGTLGVPTLLLCGGADRIISVAAARRWFDRLQCEKRCVEFSGAYHELHHEGVRDEVLRLVRDWTLGRQGAEP
jgi:alpha-beta hydrolase superfamily lysophospholipase